MIRMASGQSNGVGTGILIGPMMIEVFGIIG